MYLSKVKWIVHFSLRDGGEGERARANKWPEPNGNSRSTDRAATNANKACAYFGTAAA